MLAAVGRIAAAVPLPVTADLEAGYGDAGETIRRALAVGVVGANLEDQVKAFDEAVSAVRAAVQAAESEGVPFALNARTDVVIKAGDRPRDEVLADAVARGRAFLEEGATCVFVPGALSKDEIARLVDGARAAAVQPDRCGRTADRRAPGAGGRAPERRPLVAAPRADRVRGRCSHDARRGLLPRGRAPAQLTRVQRGEGDALPLVVAEGDGTVGVSTSGRSEPLGHSRSSSPRTATSARPTTLSGRSAVARSTSTRSVVRNPAVDGAVPLAEPDEHGVPCALHDRRGPRQAVDADDHLLAHVEEGRAIRPSAPVVPGGRARRAREPAPARRRTGAPRTRARASCPPGRGGR